MKNFMRTRTLGILSVTLGIAVFFSPSPLAAQHAQASRNHDAANEVYSPSLTPAIYLVNFLLLTWRIPTLPSTCRYTKRLFLNRSSIAWSKIPRGPAVRMLITANTLKTPMVAVIKTGSASGLTCARSHRNGRTWHRANSDRLETSTSHWEGDGPISSLTSLAWTQA